MKKTIIAFGTAVILVMSVPSFAGQIPEPWVNVRITTNEQVIIRDYYHTHQLPVAEMPKKKKLPPGLQKKLARGGQLPPGWQKKVARGEVLDAHVYTLAHPLPPDLTRMLPPPQSGVATIIVEGRIVRLIEATRTILDAFDIH
jgi:hypothetical protein